MTEELIVMPPIDEDSPDPEKVFETEDSEIPREVYNHQTGRYWVNKDGEWVSLNSDLFKMFLESERELKTYREPGGSELQRHMIGVASSPRTRVWYSGPLAGYRQGLYRFESDQALVTRSHPVIRPVPGDWSTLEAFIDGLLWSDRDKIQQAEHFNMWVKHAFGCLQTGRPERGLALVLAGEPNSGKTLMVQILKHIFGGKSAKPYRYMIGKDTFNKELFESVLLEVDDENAETGIKERLKFGGEIKQITAAEGGRCRGMNQEAKTLYPLWRLVICCNNEPDRLMVLPPLDNDIADKMLILRGYTKKMPMPSETPAERDLLKQTLLEQCKHYLYDLMQGNIATAPSSRLGCEAWHHPDVVDSLFDLSPEKHTWDFVRRTIFKYHDVWEGTADDLRGEFLADGSGLTDHEKTRHVKESVWIGRHLGQLRHKYSDHIIKGRDKYKNYWKLIADPESVTAEDV